MNEQEHSVRQQQSKKPNALVLALGLLLCIALVTAGVFFFLWTGESKNAADLQSSLDTSNQQIESLNEQLANASSTPEPAAPTSPMPVVDEDTAITDAVGAYVHTQVVSEHDELTMQVSKKESPFARVLVSASDGGGYACVLKQSDGIWVVLFCGQGVPLQSELDQWGVPDSVL